MKKHTHTFAIALVLGTMFFAFSACKKEDVAKGPSIPAPTPPALTCDGLTGVWGLAELFCNEVQVNLTGAGIITFSVDFGNAGSTQAETNVIFANGCEMRVTWTKQGTGNSWTALPISENCTATCTPAQCDGTLPTAQSITCTRNSLSKFNASTANAGICNSVATSREVYLKAP